MESRVFASRKALWALASIAAAAGVGLAGEPNTPETHAPAADAPSNWLTACCERETLTDGFCGAAKTLEECGISWTLGLTQVYQHNLRGGLATHRRAGRYTGSYDLDVEFDMEKIAGVPGGIVFVGIEGGWSDGLDDSSVGSLFGVNADAMGNEPILIRELWYEQNWLDGRVIVRAGRIDLTGTLMCHECPVAFDGSLYANDETAQFLNAALVNNPTIPFPEYGLGAIAHAESEDGVYLSAGVADAQAKATAAGLHTAFHEEAYYFGIFETGYVGEVCGGMTGAYRLGFWLDPQPKERLTRGAKTNDMGLYVTIDQQVYRENPDDEQDTQGAGLFARYGYAHADVAEVHQFWSLGGQYQGLCPGRDDDVLGVGFAQGRISGHAGPRGRDPHETVFEVYYNARVCSWLNLTGDVQYVVNPGADSNVGDAVVFGMRAQINW